MLMRAFLFHLISLGLARTLWNMYACKTLYFSVNENVKLYLAKQIINANYKIHDLANDLLWI
jgi:hypothetical protein